MAFERIDLGIGKRPRRLMGLRVMMGLPLLLGYQVLPSEMRGGFIDENCLS